jgi:hypothetical protein
MNINQHQLFLSTKSDVLIWVPNQNMDIKHLRQLIEGSDEYKPKPRERYELGSFYWCLTFSSVFNRLNQIKNMTLRSLYHKKNENKAKLKKDWMVYNYHIFAAVYQSVLEVGVLITNEILDLGNQPTQCHFDQLIRNRRVKEAKMDVRLKSIAQITEKYRNIKNRLLHQGKGTRPHINVRLSAFDITSTADRFGMNEGEAEELAQYLAERDQQLLANQMKDEIKEIKLQVEKLLDELQPYYTKVRTFYIA